MGERVATLITIGPGMCIALPAGTGDGHHFLNETDNDAAFLVVGDRTAGDEATYPEIDLALKAGPMERRDFAIRMVRPIRNWSALDHRFGSSECSKGQLDT
jgi:uncharacterized cupin superfamily protein